MDHASTDGFGEFFRRYARTWYHAVATAALTAFGTLTVVDNRFAAVALLAYALPPVALYARGGLPATDAGADGAATGEERARRPDTPAPTDWRAPSLPTDADLHAAAVTDEGAYAAGDDGVVIGGADDWETVLADGPGGDARALHGLAAVPEALWVAGDGGALGRIDPATGRRADHSAPAGDTNSLTDVAAAADADGETVLVADGSGALRRGRHRGGEVAWDDPVTPGSGASVAAVALDADGVGYAVDTDDGVFRTRDDGRSFERVGLDAADTFVDVTATPTGCLVLDEDGRLHRLDDGWTHERLPGAAPRAVAAAGEHHLVADEGGVVHERTGAGDDWTRYETPAAGSFAAVGLGSERAVAAGAAGTVATRGPPE
jgi:hypothetical protein